MAILSPFGRVCMTSNPILKSHFTVHFSRSGGGANASFDEDDSLEVLSVPSLGYGFRVQDWVGLNSALPMIGYREKVQEIQMQFRLFDDSTGWLFWKSWMDSIYDPTSSNDEIKIAGYTGQGSVTLWKSAGKSMEEHIVIKIQRAWPSQFRIDNLDMNSEGEPVTYTVNLQADNIIISPSEP